MPLPSFITSITPEMLDKLAKLLLIVEPAVATIIRGLLAHAGVNVDDLLQQTANTNDHTRLFLQAEAARVTAELIAKGESIPDSLPVSLESPDAVEADGADEAAGDQLPLPFEQNSPTSFVVADSNIPKPFTKS